MSSASAAVLSLALYALAIAPLVLAARRPATARPIAFAYVGLILVIVGVQTSFWERPSYAAFPTARAPASGMSAQCAQAIDLLNQSHVILDRSNPSRPVVNQRLWEQIPPPVRDGVVACLDQARPVGSGGGPVEVVVQNAL